MKFMVLAFFFCAASAASITPSKQESAEKSVIKAAGEVAAVTGVASKLGASAVTLKGASPVVASEVVAAAVAASEVIAAHASKVAAPVVKSEVVSTPVVTSEVITAPVAALKTVKEPTVEVAQVTPVVKEVKPVGKDAEAVILHENSVVNSEGFKYAFENDNGIGAKATGELKKVGDVNVVTTRGAYKYVGADGVPVEVTYTADETGFHPQSDILPVAPKIPVAIARALAFIASHPPKPETRE